MSLIFQLSQNQRRIIALSLVVVDTLSILVSLAALTIGIFLKLLYRDYKSIRASELSEHFPHLIMAASCFSFASNAFSAYVNLNAADWRQVYINQQFFLIGPFVKLILQLVELFIFVIIGFQFNHFEESLAKGFASGFRKRMAEYYMNIEHKMLLDRIQVHYRCCGPEKYNEWFGARWFRENYVTEEINDTVKHLFMSNGFFVGSVVPFSCCSIKSMRPCIRWLVTEDGLHYNYNPRVDTTLYTKGCGQALVQGLSYWMVVVGAVILIHNVIKVANILISRLLQTSIQLAIDYADPTQTAPGYFISFGVAPVPPGALRDEDAIQRRNDVLADLAFGAEDVDALTEIKLAEMDRFNQEEGYVQRKYRNSNVSGNRNVISEDSFYNDDKIKLQILKLIMIIKELNYFRKLRKGVGSKCITHSSKKVSRSSIDVSLSSRQPASDQDKRGKHVIKRLLKDVCLSQNSHAKHTKRLKAKNEEYQHKTNCRKISSRTQFRE